MCFAKHLAQKSRASSVKKTPQILQLRALLNMLGFMPCSFSDHRAKSLERARPLLLQLDPPWQLVACLSPPCARSLPVPLSPPRGGPAAGPGRADKQDGVGGQKPEGADATNGAGAVNDPLAKCPSREALPSSRAAAICVMGKWQLTKQRRIPHTVGPEGAGNEPKVPMVLNSLAAFPGAGGKDQTPSDKCLRDSQVSDCQHLLILTHATVQKKDPSFFGFGTGTPRLPAARSDRLRGKVGITKANPARTSPQNKHIMTGLSNCREPKT